LTVDDIQFAKGLDRAQSRLKFFGRAVSATFVGNALKRMSEEILEVQRKIADGSLEAGQGTAAFGDAVAKSLPVLGNYYEAAKNIILAINGTAAATEEAVLAMQQMQREVAAMRQMRQNSLAMEALTKSVREYGQELEDAVALETAASGADRERIQMAIDHRKALEKVAEMEKKAREMPLTESGMDQSRRKRALDEVDRERFRAQHLADLRQANWQKRQEEANAKEAERLAEEKAKLAAEQFQLVKGIEERIVDLRIDAIEDEEERALEAIKVRYERERIEILNNGRTLDEQDEALAVSEAARRQEIANLERQQQRQREDSIKSLDDQIAAASDEADASLTDQERRLRAIGRQEAAALAGAEVGGAVNLDVGERIAKLAEFQRAAVNAANVQEDIRSSAGAFSGAAIQSLQGGAISAAEETAENTAALVKSTSELIREVRKKGQFFL
jgi:hypothetical protein